MNNYDNVAYLIGEKVCSIEEAVNLVKNARDDYHNIKQLISYFNAAKVSLSSAQIALCGMNYDEEEGFFDADFGVLCVTVKKNSNNELEVDKYVDVYTLDENLAFKLDMSESLDFIISGDKK